MELLNNFGINPILLIAQIINFLVVFYVLKRYLYKPILTMLKTRDNTIKEGLKQAEEARLLLEKTAERERETLRKAQNQAKELIEETKRQREELLSLAEEAARKQAERILTEAREQITFETREVEKRLTSHISDLAIQLLNQSVGDLVNKDQQELIVRQALKRIKRKAD